MPPPGHITSGVAASAAASATLLGDAPRWVAARAAACTVVVWTVGEMLALPLTNAAVAHRAHPASRGSYMGAYTVSFSAAFVVAPALGTFVYQVAGPAALWGAIGVVGAVLGVGFWRLAPEFSRGAAPAATPERRAEDRDRTVGDAGS